MTKSVPVGWVPYLDDFATALRAGGAPETTIGTRLNHLRRVARTFGAPSPLEVDGDQLTLWAGRQDWSIETRRGYRGSLLAFYRWMVGSGRATENPAAALPRVAPAKPKPRPAPDSVYATALMKATPRERVMLRLASECGLRRAEVALVHSRDLSEDLCGWSLVVHGKGRKDRVLPLPDEIAAELRRLPRGWAFPGNDCGHLSPRWVGKLMTELLPDDWTMHKLRHRFATRAYRNTRNIRAVQQLLGHESVATTQVYTAVDDDELRAAMNAAA
ncbi:tyrosine-type recombinase/integrase [Rhodococcus opacus]|uniref:Putative tyrosine recombinase n=1 Tax=Rhodococcus opacus (strain B4) TaxID=632772 RepID=C1B9F6_RHOOB|nr:tyrosine-type recombinase/integrase [Rhodococcus opacus]BAH52309.1 putative tyrosine recombinase [Rhodococcus opacus B4]